jgi:hypothetical protein
MDLPTTSLHLFSSPERAIALSLDEGRFLPDSAKAAHPQKVGIA